MSFSLGALLNPPDEKDIYFFPAQLSHQVYPFKSNIERVSVSVNFADRIDAELDLGRKGER